MTSCCDSFHPVACHPRTGAIGGSLELQAYWPICHGDRYETVTTFSLIFNFDFRKKISDASIDIWRKGLKAFSFFTLSDNTPDTYTRRSAVRSPAVSPGISAHNKNGFAAVWVFTGFRMNVDQFLLEGMVIRMGWEI